MFGAAMSTIWLPVLAFVCLSIYARIQRKYFDALLAASKISDDASFRDLVYLYREDLLIFGVIAPLFTVLLFAKLRFWLAAAISGIAIVLLQGLLYANLQSWGQVGSFLTWQALQNAVSFGFSQPQFVGEYLSIDGLLKLALLLVISAGILIFGRRFRSHIWPNRALGTVGWLAVLGCAALSLLGYSSNMRAAPISDSFAVNALSALLKGGAASEKTVPASELSERYAQLANIQGTGFQGPNFRAQEGSNLLLVVMETASIEFLDTRIELPDHPALNALKDKSYIASNHFSTFPASAESNFSILTGTYPPRAIYGTCLIDMPRLGQVLPGPIKQLNEVGYRTALYAPYVSQVPADKTVFDGAGFQKVVYGESLTGSGSADERAVDQLAADIAGWTEADEPFAAVLLPQIGHGPWPKELGATVQERGANRVQVQLDWLSQLIEQLRLAGKLDDTVILVTGDHGVRTAIEDKRVKVGMIDQYAFHVPLLLYAPKADYSDLERNLPSSHVDISAELIELFGLPRLPSYQGLALHHPERQTRRSFLMAGWYYGANGYRDRDGAAMYSDLLDAVYAHSGEKVQFGEGDLIADEQPRTLIKDRLRDIEMLQGSWIESRVCLQ